LGWFINHAGIIFLTAAAGIRVNTMNIMLKLNIHRTGLVRREYYGLYFSDINTPQCLSFI